MLNFGIIKEGKNLLLVSLINMIIGRNRWQKQNTETKCDQKVQHIHSVTFFFCGEAQD